MKALGLFAATALAATTAGCVIVDAEVDGDNYNPRYSKDAERVYSASIDENSITINVAASGCTNEAFFEPEIDHKGDDVFAVEFVRQRRDYCKMLQPNGEKLTYSFSSLGLPAGAQVMLVNPVGK